MFYPTFFHQQEKCIVWYQTSFFFSDYFTPHFLLLMQQRHTKTKNISFTQFPSFSNTSTSREIMWRAEYYNYSINTTSLLTNVWQRQKNPQVLWDTSSQVWFYSFPSPGTRSHCLQKQGLGKLAPLCLSREHAERERHSSDFTHQTADSSNVLSQVFTLLSNQR